MAGVVDPAIERRFNVIAATFAARVSIWLYCVYAIGQGAGIILGGDKRWSSPTFQYLVKVPGVTFTWGLVLAAAGTIALVGSVFRIFALKLLGLAGIIFWSLCFSAGAFAATLHDPRVGTTSGPVHLVVALAVVVLTSISERKEEGRHGTPPEAVDDTPAPFAPPSRP